MIFVTGFFHLSSCPHSTSVVQQTSVLRSFLWPNNILVYECATFYSSILLLIDIWVLAAFGSYE